MGEKKHYRVNDFVDPKQTALSVWGQHFSSFLLLELKEMEEIEHLIPIFDKVMPISMIPC